MLSKNRGAKKMKHQKNCEAYWEQCTRRHDNRRLRVLEMRNRIKKWREKMQSRRYIVLALVKNRRGRWRRQQCRSRRWRCENQKSNWQIVFYPVFAWLKKNSGPYSHPLLSLSVVMTIWRVLNGFPSHPSVLLPSFSSYPFCRLYLSGRLVGRPTNTEKTSNSSVFLHLLIFFFSLLLRFVTWPEPFDTYLVHLGVQFTHPNHRFKVVFQFCLDNTVFFDKVNTFCSEGVGNFYRRSSFDNQYCIL